MAEASMWISRCQAVVLDLCGSQPDRRREAQQQAVLSVFGDLRQAAVAAEKKIRAALTPARRRPHA
jgi:hypothetical protein